MFCSDCLNDKSFKEVDGYVICTDCGLVIQHHVIDHTYYPDCEPMSECKRYEMEFVEMLHKFDLSESFLDDIMELFEKFKVQFPMRGENFSNMKLACISVISNLKVCNDSRIYYRVKEFYRGGIKNAKSRDSSQKKEYANDMVLLNELIGANVKYDTSIRKSVYKMIDKLPSVSKELSRIRERNIYLGLIFLSIKKNVDIKEYCRYNNISTVTLQNIKKLICGLTS